MHYKYIISCQFVVRIEYDISMLETVFINNDRVFFNSGQHGAVMFTVITLYLIHMMAPLENRSPIIILRFDVQLSCALILWLIMPLTVLRA